MDETKFKSISFRLNLSDNLDNELYEQIVQESKYYASISAFSKDIFTKYFRRKEQKDFIEEMKDFEKRLSNEVCRIIREEMQEQSMKMVGALISGMGVKPENIQEVNKSSIDDLPGSDDSLPDELSGVLDFIG